MATRKAAKKGPAKAEQPRADTIEVVPASAAPMKFSWSKINSYETCPFMFKCQSIDNRITEVNPLMIVGRVTHHAINLYNKHCFAKKVEHDFDKWKDCAYMALETENLEAEHYPDVMKMVESYAQSHMIPLESAIGAEEGIALTRDYKVTEWMAPDVWFRSQLDYLQIAGNQAKITDYKSGWLLSAPKLQMKIYAWAVKKAYPQVEQFEIEVDFVRHEYQERFTVTDEEIPEIERMILTKTNKIEKDTKYKPNVGIACSYCGCWRWCPAMKEQDIGFKMPMDDQEAAALAAKLEQYTKLKAEAQKILRTFCDNHGEVIAGGKKYGFSVSSGYDIEDVSQFIAGAEDLGVDVFDCLTINNRDLKPKLMNEAFKEFVEKIAKKTIAVKFTSKKYKEKEDMAPDEATPVEPAE